MPEEFFQKALHSEGVAGFAKAVFSKEFRSEVHSGGGEEISYVRKCLFVSIMNKLLLFLIHCFSRFETICCGKTFEDLLNLELKLWPPFWRCNLNDTHACLNQPSLN